jgi:glutaryl-CoA dehydrogenase
VQITRVAPTEMSALPWAVATNPGRISRGRSWSARRPAARIDGSLEGLSDEVRDHPSGVRGAADACYQCALDYARERVQFDRPIASFQLQQEKLARMVTELTRSQLLALHLGRLKDGKGATPAQVSMAKMSNVAAAREICATARTNLGANGIHGEYPVMRHMANLESVYTYEGTHDMHLLVIGEAITGIPAFR